MSLTNIKVWQDKIKDYSSSFLSLFLETKSFYVFVYRNRDKNIYILLHS